MAQYKQKDIIIEAEHAHMLLYKASHDWYKLPHWAIDAYDSGKLLFLDKEIRIKNYEGVRIAEYNDMVIFKDGELTACTTETFSKTYEYIPE